MGCCAGTLADFGGVTPSLTGGLNEGLLRTIPFPAPHPFHGATLMRSDPYGLPLVRVSGYLRNGVPVTIPIKTGLVAIGLEFGPLGGLFVCPFSVRQGPVACLTF